MAALRFGLVLLFALLYIQNALAIKGSTMSRKGDFPFQADLIVNFPSSGTLYRTGSLFSPNYILTTASNVLGSSKITIVMGVYNVEDKQDPNRRTYTGISYKTHEKYNQQTGANNIAVVKLNQSSEINDHIKVVPIPRFSYVCLPLVGKTVRVSGWGDVTAQTPIEFQVLRYADIKIKSFKECKSIFPKTTYKQLCGTNPTKYFEESDIGAPLILGKTLVGIAAETSYINGVAKSPQLYTRLDAHLEWIETNSDITILEN